MSAAQELEVAESNLKDYCDTLYPAHEDEAVSPLFTAIEAYVDARIKVGVAAYANGAKT